MDFFKKIESWCAVGLITFFFIPWIKMLDIWSVNGIQAANLSREFSPLVTIAFYTIPVLGFIILFQGSRNRLSKGLVRLTGLYPIILFLIGYFTYGRQYENYFSLLLGVYLTLVASFCLLISSFIKNRKNDSNYIK
jgi:hypothetical protein